MSNLGANTQAYCPSASFTTVSGSTLECFKEKWLALTVALMMKRSAPPIGALEVWYAPMVNDRDCSKRSLP